MAEYKGIAQVRPFYLDRNRLNERFPDKHCTRAANKMLLKIPTIALAALSLSNTAAAHVTWLVNYDTNKPAAAENCAELRIVDYGVNGGGLTIADWVCNGREHNGDRQWTFDYAGKFNWYSATIHQSSFYYIDGFGITYRTDHGTFYWDTGRMDFKGNGFYSKEGRALG
jgi:hypothetical protein